MPCSGFSKNRSSTSRLSTTVAWWASARVRTSCERGERNSLANALSRDGDPEVVSVKSSWNGRLLCRCRGSSTRRQKEPHAERSRPMSSLSQRSVIHLGMDVHKDSISIVILRPDDSMDVERIFHDEDSVRRFIARMGKPRQLVACYEAGPTGYELHRLLQRLQVPCHVVAPSLIPKAPGDRVKTDRRGCRGLGRLPPGGGPIPHRGPGPAEGAGGEPCPAPRGGG